MFSSLLRATVGAVIDTPISIAADVVTLGGTLTDRSEPYTSTAIRNVKKNVEDAAEPSQD